MDRKSTKLYRFGRNLHNARKLKGLTQEELAEKVDLTREHIAKVEVGIRGVSINTLFKIAEVLDVPEKELFDFK